MCTRSRATALMGSVCNIESRPTTCQVLRPLVVLESAPSTRLNVNKHALIRTTPRETNRTAHGTEDSVLRASSESTTQKTKLLLQLFIPHAPRPASCTSAQLEQLRAAPGRDAAFWHANARGEVRWQHGSLARREAPARGAARRRPPRRHAATLGVTSRQGAGGQRHATAQHATTQHGHEHAEGIAKHVLAEAATDERGPKKGAPRARELALHASQPCVVARNRPEQGGQRLQLAGGNTQREGLRAPRGMPSERLATQAGHLVLRESAWAMALECTEAHALRPVYGTRGAASQSSTSSKGSASSCSRVGPSEKTGMHPW